MIRLYVSKKKNKKQKRVVTTRLSIVFSSHPAYCRCLPRFDLPPTGRRVYLKLSGAWITLVGVWHVFVSHLDVEKKK
jgi:hypothetical protein